jgi:hypothetical protein
VGIPGAEHPHSNGYQVKPLGECGFVKRWELWEGESDHSFFPADNEQAREMAKAEGEVLVWEVMAQGWNPAMRLLYEHLGWGEYKPMLREDGTTYPEDEDDDYSGPPS